MRTKESAETAPSVTFGQRSKDRTLSSKLDRLNEVKDHYLLSRVTAFDEMEVPFEVDESYD